ncbi:hypothetical protein D0Z08_29880 [Nocardioides immobilis]|uniref:Uncharacterized protein n=1 Tax=Nocardioides immobilis TaxID=2049295 RepID=A0A417XSY9_9ACTN|nr:hypothetical protein [Nocardioides immobilis]RHW23436.1 hypothetical protein D0Z08_29880 [Nocardioides immobilis]
MELHPEGTGAHVCGKSSLPEDETCLLCPPADSVDAVHEAARRTSVAFERVTEVIPEPPD